MTRTLLIGLAGLLFALGAHSAQAAIVLNFNTNVESKTIATPIGASDTISITGVLATGAGAVTNTTTFTAGAGIASLIFNAVWRSGAAGDVNRLLGVNIDLLDSTDTVIASDNFLGVLGGFAVSELSFAGLSPGGDYTLLLTGTNQGVANYLITGAFLATPVPAAFLLLAPALAGLGFAGYRRTKA